MSKYSQISGLNPEAFKRATGVKPEVFSVMVKILQAAEIEKNKQGGKPNKLTLEDRLLMTLEYLREYRTFFHIAHSYGVSESTCYRNCCWIEDVLVKSGKFRLPGRKHLIKSDTVIECLLVDATEAPIERPKKNE